MSRSFVSQTTTLLEKYNLIKKQSPSNYNSFYEISPELKAQLAKDGVPEFTHCDTHYVKRKYRILHKSGEVSKDKRAGYLKSWKMHGWTGHKFWYPGGAGQLRIALDVRPKSIVAYCDARQKVIARSIPEAEDIIRMSIHNAVQRFIRCQAKFGVHIEIDEIGQQITPTHYAFPMPEGHPVMAGGIKSIDEWTDGSPQTHGEPGRVEYETTNRTKATALSEAIDKVMMVESLVKDGIREAMPEAMKDFEKAFAPLKEEIGSVMAYVQSGMTAQNQLQQLTFLVAKQLADNHALKEELARVKSEQPMTTTLAEPHRVSAYAPSYED